MLSTSLLFGNGGSWLLKYNYTCCYIKQFLNGLTDVSSIKPTGLLFIYIMSKKLHIFLISIVIFVIASWLSVYSYGTFAKRVRGEPSYALPVVSEQTIFEQTAAGLPVSEQTKIDKVIEPLWQENPGKNGLVLLQDNLDAFLVRAITAKEAGRSLDLQYYIWHDDLTGYLLDLEIVKAADRGVRVRMLLDDMNVHGRDSTLAALNTHPNIEIRLFNPTRARDSGFSRGGEMLLRIFSVNRRMHNKAWIADGRVAIVGGRNIGDEYFNASANTNFFDVDVMVSGDAVFETSAIFDEFWNSEAVVPLEALVTKPPRKSMGTLHQFMAKRLANFDAKPYLDQLTISKGIKDLYEGKRKVYWASDVHVYSDPADKAFGKERFRWLLHNLMPIWKGADERLELISPYFVPGQDGLELFRYLREKGSSIEILTNSLAATDVMLSHSGYIPYRVPLLEAGADIYELKPFGESDKSLLGSSGASLHTKAFLVNGKIGFVGSFNFDPRSVRLNTEMGVVFEEPSIVAELEEEFKRRTQGGYSYNVVLTDGELEWRDNAATPPAIWEYDPHTKWWQRTVTKVMSWLPIESQL